jgi:hypothetical protein
MVHVEVLLAQEEALAEDGWGFTLNQIRMVTYLLRLSEQRSMSPEAAQ